MTDKPKPRRLARELLTRQSEHLLATRYAGQVRAVVIERALQRMADDDERAERKPKWRGRQA